MAEFKVIVKDIVDEYINSILFVDERAFVFGQGADQLEKATDLDVSVVSRSFTKAGKICSFFAPRTNDDIDECKKLVLKPEIVILDWNIKIEQPVTAEDEMQDDEVDDRGHYTLELLKTIVNDAGDEKLKVVFIYTGETDILEIIHVVSKELGQSFQPNEEECEVSSDNVHILVRLKPDSKVSHAGFDKFKVSYEKLPNTVIEEFANHVKGLMPCFAMKSLSCIRDSSAKVLKLYSSDLDSELLGHQMALPDPDDARTYLVNGIGSGITELIMDNPNVNTDLWVDAWINSFIPPEERVVTIEGKQFSVSQKSLEKFFNDRYLSNKVEKRIKSAFNVTFNKKTRREEENAVISNMSSLFGRQDFDATDCRYRFAYIGHSKNLFSSKNHNSHILTLGTIVKDTSSGLYLLCIQQRCDTARVAIDGMKFMFIPLSEHKDNHPLIGAIATGWGTTLYIPKSSKQIELIHFRPSEANKPVVSVEKEGHSFFISEDSEYVWVGELKELVAQRIVTSFVGHFARVGIDEAEWLRVESADS